ncbi:neurotrophin 1 isoform X2 [Eurosta solidaginis]|uniref:neurotrophin 1 isoform X2 n=1 Tax=Eurosta solidaginis TaxID=178769 RepID=UPI0035310AD7
MKLQKIFSHLTFAVLFCTLAVADDDIADFDFTDMKEIERSHDINGMKGQLDVLTERGTLVKFNEFEEENQVRPFDWREKILRGALSKALTNSSLRQKFVEVMPILRVLSSQQRLALSALISSQINANMDHGLNFEQVRKMFGDDKKLLIPIIYDIANLVWNSAQKYVYHDMNTHSKNQYQQKTVINRRLDILSLAELSEEGTDKIIGNLSISSDKGNNELSLENFFSETAEKILDPQSINEELQEGVGKSAESKLNIIITLPKTQNELSITKRNKRAVVEPEFVHKLIRSIPLSNNPEENETKNIVKLNTSGFLSSKDLTTDSITKSANISLNKFSSYESTPHTHNQTKPDESYQDIENTAFASFNETQQQESTKSVNEVKAPGEPLPMPEELNAGPRYRITKNKMHSRRPNLSAAKRKRIQTPRARTKITANGNSIAPSKKCERFTSSMCIRTDDYPLDQIMGSIRRHKNAMVALWADYHDKSFHLDITDDLEEYPLRRREDDATGGGMCQSIVRYARPQKARSASGEWKYIVNTGKHTQTLRLEKCTTPQESCSYLAQSYRSHCAQIYNYHRLLSWDKTRGLHVDIFKVPTCCSCQVDGFRQQFPPLAKLVTKEFTPAYSSDVYSTINEELDYNDKLDEEDLTYQIHSGFRENHKKHDIGYYNNELLISSQSVQTKLHSPNPTLGLYLKPPRDEQEYDGFDYKHQHVGKPNISSSESPGKITIESSRERPYKSLGTANINSEARVDLDFSPSELHHEKELISAPHLQFQRGMVQHCFPPQTTFTWLPDSSPRPQWPDHIKSAKAIIMLPPMPTKRQRRAPTTTAVYRNNPIQVTTLTPFTKTDQLLAGQERIQNQDIGQQQQLVRQNLLLPQLRQQYHHRQSLPISGIYFKPSNQRQRNLHTLLPSI